MSGHLPLDTTQWNPLGNDKGSATRILLLALLLLVAVAGYLFYFTDIFKPHQEPAKPPAGQTAQVKQPIPPRPGQGGEAGTAQVKPGEAKPPQAAPAPPAAAPAGTPAPIQPPQPGQKPIPAKPAATTAPPPAAAPKPSSPAPVPSPAPAKTPKAAVPPAAPTKTAKAAVPTAVPAPTPKAKVTAAAPKSAPPATTTAKSAQKPEKPVEKQKGGPYRLLLGDFVPDKSFGTFLAKLKKNGIDPVRKSSVTASEPMNRLFIREFNDQDSAEAELQTLKKLTADAFLMAKDGKYELFAGSYLSSSRAASEMKKLGSKGVRPVIRQARVSVKVTRVTAGSYASSGEARKDAARLKKIGINSTVVKTAK
jgi:cell division septation protein DedD